MIDIINADVMAGLAQLADSSVHCVVTSPPYWGLRDYGTASWEGGDEGCDHVGVVERTGAPGSSKQASNFGANGVRSGNCKCGATRIDNQIGLEKTPELYVEKMVAVFREVRRVLRDDGTVWLNLGDSYAGNGGGASAWSTPLEQTKKRVGNADLPARSLAGLKPKDLVGIPWMVARALQAPYYLGQIKSELDRVWLSAMIDAEGTICGYTHVRKDNGGTRHGIHITVTNSNTALLDRCFEIWPTTREHHNMHGFGHIGDLPTWRWIVHGMEQKSALLAELYPYFVGKKKQALLAWNFLEISKKTRGRNKGEEGQENRERYAWIVEALSKLNHLEPVDIPNWIKEPPKQYADGWWLRSDIVWAKPNPMPESVTDRPTKSHEYIFLLSKSANYYFDQDAVREPQIEPWRSGNIEGARERPDESLETGRPRSFGWEKREYNPAGRNIRTVWEIATQPYPDAHFATFPEEIAKRCILAGTSERGCCVKCGAPWERVVERESVTPIDYNGKHSTLTDPQSAGRRMLANVRARREAGGNHDQPFPPSKTLGWQSVCICGEEKTERCTVLDPFAGSGTVGAVALELGRKAVLIELNEKYCELIDRRTQVTYGMMFA